MVRVGGSLFPTIKVVYCLRRSYPQNAATWKRTHGTSRKTLGSEKLAFRILMFPTHLLGVARIKRHA